MIESHLSSAQDDLKKIKLYLDVIEMALHPEIRCLKTLKNALISMQTRL